MKYDPKNLLAEYMDPEDLERLVDYPSFAALWEARSAEYADLTAVEDNGEKYAFARLEADAAGLRTRLKEAGVNKGDRVGVFAPNSYGFVKAFIAAVTLGATAAVLPPHLDAPSVFGCTMKFGLKAIIAAPELIDNCTLAAERAKVCVISAEDGADTPTPVAEVKPEDGCVIMFTGGTTGKSKGALLSNRAVMQGILNSSYGCKNVFHMRYLLVLPLSHVFGLIRNLLASLNTGSTIFICRNNQDMFRDIAYFKPTILVIVPALAEMALALSKKFRRNMLGDSLKYIICGAASVPPYLIKEYAALGIDLYPGYGLTESSNLVSGNVSPLEKPDSVGLPYPNQELKIVDGELLIRGDNMMDGYIGEDEAGVWEDGWFKTGDLARIDEDGFIYITGRKKEIIVLPTGENISPAELEAKFNECSLVADSQVFEDKNEAGRHFLALEVVPRAAEMAKFPADDAPAILMSELNLINSKLPPFQRVSRIEIRDRDFERTKSLKIVRYKKCE